MDLKPQAEQIRQAEQDRQAQQDRQAEQDRQAQQDRQDRQAEQAEEVRRAKEEALRLAEEFRQAALEPEQQREWIRQNNVIYGGLIAIGVVLVQQFLTVTTPTLNWSAKICVIAFSVAIPLLTALILINHQETFRRRVADSVAVRVTRPVAQLLALVGLVAGFWHITWLAGVGVLASSFVAMLVHSAGYLRVERAARAARPDKAGQTDRASQTDKAGQAR